MAFLRTCYQTPARFFPGDTSGALMQWYWAPPGAKVFYGHNAFSSGVFLNNKVGPNIIGEIPGAPRTYSKGELPFPVAGTNVCGDPLLFETGARFLPASKPTRLDGSYLCCDPAPCLCAYPPGLPSVLHATLHQSNFADPCNCFNGAVFPLTRTDSHTWIGSLDLDPFCGAGTGTMVLTLRCPLTSTNVKDFTLEVTGCGGGFVEPTTSASYPPLDLTFSPRGGFCCHTPFFYANYVVEITI